jgi:hypothetical protein
MESDMRNKMQQSKFKLDMSQALLDFIDYGNCFGTVEFIHEERTDPETEEVFRSYVGPKFVRISPHDIVFNPLAASFKNTPKIIRVLTTLPDLKAYIEDHPEASELAAVFDKMMGVRHQFNGVAESDFAKSEAYQMDGFGTWMEYMESEYVELLHYHGDLYDAENGELYKNYKITVMDRAHVLEKTPHPSWLGHAPVYHVPWRQRPDNLYGMGPLDNLVGMQHRIDHLENAKADAYDLIIHPVMKIRGMVEDFDYGPSERIYVGDEGDVEFMRPDTTMLSADTQIAIYEQRMEEMAGAPKQAMGFRTPGEKTAYEVQVLENGANKVFLNKASYFEEQFVEPVLNSMLETGRRNMALSETIRRSDPNVNAVEFLKITREDLSAEGTIRPIGARHFARNANIVQNITQFYASGLAQDPGVRPHISGLKIAQTIEELLDLERFDLVEENAQVYEQQDTQRAAATSEQRLMEENGVPTQDSGMPNPGPAQRAAPTPN